jgi:hypothetical protein
MLRAAAILTRRKVEKVRVDDVYTKKKTALHCYTSQLGDEVTLPQQIVSRALNDPELYFRASPHPRNSTA